MPAVRQPATAASTSPLQVTDLVVEREAQPIGVDDDRPLFGWVLRGRGHGRMQQTYRIRVTDETDPADETQPAVWDTGAVASARSYDVAYAGPALAPRTRYRWAVRVQDDTGWWSAWVASSFETARLGSADWDATRWIGGPGDGDDGPRADLDAVPAGPDIRWIWLPPWAGAATAGTVTFRHVVGLPADDTVTSAAATALGPQPVHLVVNGRPVPVRAGRADGDALRTALRPGDNDVRLRVEYDERAVPGVLAHLEIRLAGGRTESACTDGRWQCATTAIAESRTAPEHWPYAAAVGVHGDPPWGRHPVTHRPSPYLRRAVMIPGAVRRARLYATALGVYEPRLNGRRVGDARLAPGWTDYRTRLCYQVYDVTELVHQGENAIGAVLADGWYAGHIAHIGPRRYGPRPLFRARLDVELDDGRTVTVGTDGTWRAGTGMTRYADLQNGEVVDARLEPAGWDAAGFDAAGWSPAVVADPGHGPLEAQLAPPVTVAAELTAVDVVRRDDGAQVVDFGQNVVGWIRLRVAGRPGTRILVRHAEMLDPGATAEPVLHTESLRTARCTDEFVLAGVPGGELFEPRFTVHGFRYCEIIGAPELTAADVTAVVAHAAMRPTGTFRCSDERVNRLHENILWSQRGNFLAVPTDCPQRDERMGWTGDAQVFAATATFGYDVRGFLRSWLRDVRRAQFAGGSVPHVVPDLLTMGGVDEADAGGAAGWGDAVVVIPHVLSTVYGDRRSIEENLDAIGAWLDHCDRSRVAGLRPATGFGDWLAVVDTPRDLVATAYLAHAAGLAARLAEQVGRSGVAARWRELRADVRRAFRRAWVRGGGEIVPGTQTAYALALCFGLFEDEEQKAAAHRLAADVRKRNWHLTTGFLGTPYLLPALSEHGQEGAAYRLLTQDTWPSWLYQVVHGDATTIWERWDSWSEARGFQDPAMTSFNHYAYGAVGDWIHQSVGGLAIGPDGPELLVVRPRPGGGITSARTVRDTVLGEVIVDWRLAGGVFTLDLAVPVGARAEVWLPEAADGPMIVGSGEHTFSARAAAWPGEANGAQDD